MLSSQSILVVVGVAAPRSSSSGMRLNKDSRERLVESHISHMWVQMLHRSLFSDRSIS
jgi:hypothetical protein